MKQTTAIQYLLVLTYFVVSLAGILHHELWLDESHHYLLARDSETLTQLWQKTRFEGHPILWNTLLYGLTRLSPDPIWMQLLHIGIATLAVWFFLRRAPFGLAFKALFIFGYFIVFEYNLIARNYSLGWLFLIVACTYFQNRDQQFIWFAIWLSLAANTHSLFAIVAVALFAASLRKTIWDRNRILGTTIFVIGVVVSMVQVWPHGDSQFLHNAAQTAIEEKFIKGFIAPFKGVFAMPDFTGFHFWNSNFFVAKSKPAAAVIGFIVYFLPLLLYKRRLTLFFVYLSLLGFQVFFFLTQLGATRYDGVTFLVLIVGLWIDRVEPAPTDSPIPSNKAVVRTVAIYAILLLHFTSGILAYSRDFIHPFSGSKKTAELIGERAKTAEIATIYCEGTIISPYLGKKVLFLCDGQFHSYCLWQLGCRTPWTSRELLDAVSRRLTVRDHIVLIINQPVDTRAETLWRQSNPNFSMVFLGQTGQAIVRNNAFYIYEFSKLVK